MASLPVVDKMLSEGMSPEEILKKIAADHGAWSEKHIAAREYLREKGLVK